MGLFVGLTCALSGCDSGAGETTEYKPIESNILKKLGSAGQAQSDAAQDEAPRPGQEQEEELIQVS